MEQEKTKKPEDLLREVKRANQVFAEKTAVLEHEIEEGLKEAEADLKGAQKFLAHAHETAADELDAAVIDMISK